MARCPLSVGLYLTSISLGFGAPPAEPGSYQLHPALEMTLFAGEPMLIDPVALTWDEAGRMFVVEMRDYPYGVGPGRAPGGAIRLLEDLDGNGKADRSTLFAEQLSFPTSIAPWNGGVVVATPPEILFLKDTDGDGKADVREVLLKGFELGVTDSNVNGLRWGLDNRLHGCNGGNGGSILSSRKPGPSIPLRNCDFSLDPATGDFSLTYHTSGGFGLVFDEWGRSFVTYNINHIQQRLIPVRYLNRFPGFPPVQAVESISDHEVMSRIYPISEPETRPNHPEQSGHFSAAGGLGYIPADYPGDLAGSLLVCDVVGNLVHRDVLTTSTPKFVAGRSMLEQKSEWFASRDPAFRPVGIELGPDGALYLIDMQRDVIEHPDYIPHKLKEKLDLRAGQDRGRIYRITPKGGLPPRKTQLRQASTRELVTFLGESNPWWRGTAQRLLIERHDKTAPDLLRKGARNKRVMARVHSLWTLLGLGALDEQLVLEALADQHPGVRENALLLSETLLPGSRNLQAQILLLADDPDPRVRFQAALTLGQLDHPQLNGALLKILLLDYPHRWTRLAVLSSLKTGEEKLFASLLGNVAFRQAASQPSLDTIREVADLIGARRTGTPAKLLTVLTNIAGPGTDENSQRAVLDGLQSGLARVGSQVAPDPQVASTLETLTRHGSPALIAAAWKLSQTLGLPENPTQREALSRSLKGAVDVSSPMPARLQDIRLLALGGYSEVGLALFSLLEGNQPGEVQQAAFEALRKFQQPEVATNLVYRWRALVPPVRSQVINLLVQRAAFHLTLIEAIESGLLSLGELNLDLEQRRRLLRRSSLEVQTRAARLMSDEEYSHRKTIVDDWLKKLPPAGDAVRGQIVFQKICAQCHQLDGAGHAVGPDLAALAHRSVEDLLSNILDPNMAINPAYVAYSVETIAGEFETGLLASESPEAVELLQANGRKLIIPRQQIKRLAAGGLSLMPEGLEAALTPADLRDLIALLQLKR